MFKVWVANLGKYNEGYLTGEWWDLEKVEDFDEEFEALSERIQLDGLLYEEYAVFDWECDVPGVKYSEYPDLEKWFEIAQRWLDLDDSDRDAVAVYHEATDAGFDECVDHIDDVICTGCEDMYDVAYNYVNDCCNVDEMGFLASYIDYKALARDLEIDGNYVDYGKCIYEVIA